MTTSEWSYEPKFILIGSAELFGTGRERKFKMKRYISSGILTRTATPRQVNGRLRLLGHIFVILNGVFIVLQYPDL